MRLSLLELLLFRVFLQSSLLTLLASASAMAWDDPLQAMPTATDSVSDKVGRLSTQALEAITTASTSSKCAFRITRINSEQEARTATPWIEVDADGRIKCTSPIPELRLVSTDSLFPDELKWLLHLAANECSALDRSTGQIARAYDTNRIEKWARPDGQSYYYSLTVGDRNNSFGIPEGALVVRPVRRKLKLDAFASLHRYASYLVARTTLGPEDKRVHILNLINAQLKLEHPTLPTFEMHHLAGASRGYLGIDLATTFTQEIPLGDKRYKQLNGSVIRKTPDDDPEITINTTTFARLR